MQEVIPIVVGQKQKKQQNGVQREGTHDLLLAYTISNMHVWSSSALSSPVCVRYLHRDRLIGGHAVTGLPKHHIRNGDVALRLVVQLQDRHLPSVVGHIKVVVGHPVLNKLCMHGSPAPLQHTPGQANSVISSDCWSLQQVYNGAPSKLCLQVVTLPKHIWAAAVVEHVHA